MIVKLCFAFVVWAVGVSVFLVVTWAGLKAVELLWRKLGRDPRAW